jgi:GT2 family glycosyltransferase
MHNEPPLGQAGNVNRLFDEVSTPYVVLMHDDDHFLPGGLTALLDVVEANPELVCVFGRQQVVEANGTVDKLKSDELNAVYGRGPNDAGLVKNHTICALKSQIPNNGAVIKTSVARKVRYMDRETVGDACDFDFAYRLSMLRLPMMMINTDVSVYQISSEAVSKNTSYKTSYTFERIQSTSTSTEEEVRLKEMLLCRRAPMAVNGYIAEGNLRLASDVYWGGHYGTKRRLSPQGLKQLIKMYLGHARFKIYH